jgi:hypothetical protein
MTGWSFRCHEGGEDAVAKWRVPAGMTGRVHWFGAREGGAFRISLTYDAAIAVLTAVILIPRRLCV